MRQLRTLGLACAVSALLFATACGSARDSASEVTSSSAGAPSAGAAKASVLRLGYFANVTQASAVYGIGSGELGRSLGGTKLSSSVFKAGPEAIEALAGGAIDAAFLGPNPAINGYANSGGTLLRIVAGASYGGAALVVRPEITEVSQLAGKRIATPQLGNTQDVAAKAYFKAKGVEVDIINQDNAQTLDLLKRGDIDGGWVPEPWASRLQIDSGGRLLVDEASLWPQGRFVTTHLVVSQKYLSAYPGTVQDLLKGLISVTDTVATNSPQVQHVVNSQIRTDTGKALSEPVLAASFRRLTATVDPVASSLRKSAQDAAAVGVSKRAVDLSGIYDLSLLNRLLAASGKPTVSDEGLGV